MNDIAALAGVSKALLFHYFGDKKSLYLYLYDFCFNNIMNALSEGYDKDEPDFFKKIESITEVKLSIMKKNPASFMFLKSLYYEIDKDIDKEIKDRIPNVDALAYDLNLLSENALKFKDGIDVRLVCKMIMWIAEGYVNQIPQNEEMDIDETFWEFKKCVALLKQNFYKEDV